MLLLNISDRSVFLDNYKLYNIVWSELSRKLIPCDCFVWSKSYTFLESLLIKEQNKHGAQFFSDSGTFCRPEWKSAQNDKNLNISWTTNAVTMKLYTIIVLRKTNIFQETPRPEMLHTLICGPEWELLFCSVKSSEIIWCEPTSVLQKIIIRHNFGENLKSIRWKDQKL